MSGPRIRIDAACGDLPLLELARSLDLDEIVVTTPDATSPPGVLEGVGGALFVQRGGTLIVLAETHLLASPGSAIAIVWAEALVCALLTADGWRPDDWPDTLRLQAAQTLLADKPTTVISARDSLAAVLTL